MVNVKPQVQSQQPALVARHTDTGSLSCSYPLVSEHGYGICWRFERTQNMSFAVSQGTEQAVFAVIKVDSIEHFLCPYLSWPK